jgi:hypothetical protein
LLLLLIWRVSSTAHVLPGRSQKQQCSASLLSQQDQTSACGPCSVISHDFHVLLLLLLLLRLQARCFWSFR